MMAEQLNPPAVFPFPFTPYDIQEQLMNQVFQALEGRKLAILESPTGTGKSLSLICGALTWLDQYNKQQKVRLQQELSRAEAAVQQSDAQDDWFSAASARQTQTDAMHDVKQKIARLQLEENRINMLRDRRKRAKQLSSGESLGRAPDGVDQLYGDLASTRDTCRKELSSVSTEELPAEEQELLLADDLELEAGKQDQQQEEEGCLKIYYCSRTHSQLSQFVGEVQKTVYGGDTTRVVALAARQNLCINPTVASLKSGVLVNDRCLELQKKRSSGKATAGSSSEGSAKGTKRSKVTHGCPYNSSAAVRGLADQVLSEVQDLEELVKRGKESSACPYYAARTAVRDAQLVVVPYTSILQPNTRAACGITLHNNCIIIDEAHNLLATLAGVQEVTVSYAQVCSSRAQLQQYLQRYQGRLSPRNLLHVNQILFCLKAFLAVLATESSKGSVGSKASPASYSQVPSDELVSVASFLSCCRVDNINLTALLRYLSASNLAHKLHGFTRLFQGSVAISVKSTVKSNSAAPPAADKSSTGSFLSRLSSGGLAGGKENSEPPEENSGTAAGVTEDSSVPSVGGNPFLQMAELLQRLVSSNESGRMLVHRDRALLKNSYIKYVVLDPALHFHDIVKQCRSVILAGGTMKPLAEFRSQLFLSAGAPSTRIAEYCCGHVVPPDNILPVALLAGPTGKTMDLTHGSRHDTDMVREVGRVLCNLSHVVPAGLVVFVPSYQYLGYLIANLKKEGFIDRIAAKKKVLEEPREASAVGAVLGEYGATIRRASATKGCYTGAMLFCVVGGKMSEGINFSDDMGRCVVMLGLPYPNTQSPELKERMKHLDATQTSDANSTERSPGASYYHNLCFRAVNQSIGRAIRHRNDYASIVLVDQRYGRASTIASLPDWITRGLVASKKFGPAQAAIAKFFARHKARTLIEKEGAA